MAAPASTVLLAADVRELVHRVGDLLVRATHRLGCFNQAFVKTFPLLVGSRDRRRVFFSLALILIAWGHANHASPVRATTWSTAPNARSLHVRRAAWRPPQLSGRPPVETRPMREILGLCRKIRWQGHTGASRPGSTGWNDGCSRWRRNWEIRLPHAGAPTGCPPKPTTTSAPRTGSTTIQPSPNRSPTTLPVVIRYVPRRTRLPRETSRPRSAPLRR